MPDLSRRELWILAPIAGAVLWMGVYPESFMAPMRRDVGVVLARLERAGFEGDAQVVRGATSRPAVVHAAAEAH